MWVGMKSSAQDLVFYVLLLLISNTASNAFGEQEKGIYGEDDRYEAREHPNALLRSMSRSVVGIVRKDLLKYQSTTQSYDFPKKTLQDLDLCPDEKFAQQIHLAKCTGFLTVSPRYLTTAGHCLLTRKDCENLAFVFDFFPESQTFPQENVYFCEKIINPNNQNSKNRAREATIVRLTRDVTDRQPLKIRTSGTLQRDTPLAMIGHPNGIPIKIVDNGSARDWTEFSGKNNIANWIKHHNYFLANLDSFAGNSGSPVINTKTGEVEGILIEGSRDWTPDHTNGCLRYKELNDQLALEAVFRITKIEALKLLLNKASGR